MNPKWKIIRSGKQSATHIMQKDLELLTLFSANSQPILHLYEWEKVSITYGYFSKPFDFINESVMVNNNLNLAKRPTGGSILFHVVDYSFSLLIPATHPFFSLNTLENYARINRLIAKEIETIVGEKVLCFVSEQSDISGDVSKAFCMAKPVQYDLMLKGKKIGGAAQRRTKAGFLHQASLFLTLPSPSFLESVLRDPPKVIQAIEQNSMALLGTVIKNGDLFLFRKEMEEMLTKFLG